MSQINTIKKEFRGAFKWSRNRLEALRLIIALSRFHIAKKSDRRDVISAHYFKNPYSNTEWYMKLRVFSGDLFILTEVFFDECYKIDDDKFLKSLSRKPRILDLGGNIGLTASYFLSCYPNVTICSVEPEPDNYLVLCENLKQFGNRANCMNAAVGDFDGKARILSAGASHSITVDLKSNGGNVDVKTISGILDSLGWDFVDVIKMDIEGSEWDIFDGSLDWLQKASLVLIEFHGNRDPNELAGRFKNLNFDLFPPGKKSGQWVLKRDRI